MQTMTKEKDAGGGDAPSYTEFAKATGISVPYAYQLHQGIRSPTLPMALHIWEKTGTRFGLLKDGEATDDEIAAMIAVHTRAGALPLHQ